jgi:hypothetical protein
MRQLYTQSPEHLKRADVKGERCGLMNLIDRLRGKVRTAARGSA